MDTGRSHFGLAIATGAKMSPQRLPLPAAEEDLKMDTGNGYGQGEVGSPLT